VVTTLAGQAWVTGQADGVGLAASFMGPDDIRNERRWDLCSHCASLIHLLSSHNLKGTCTAALQSDNMNAEGYEVSHLIRRIDISTARVTTLNVQSDFPLTPAGIAMDATGTVAYVVSAPPSSGIAVYPLASCLNSAHVSLTMTVTPSSAVSLWLQALSLRLRGLEGIRETMMVLGLQGEKSCHLTL